MLNYIARRFLIMIPTLLLLSVLAFIVIELPPGDFVTSRILALLEDGDAASLEEADNLRSIYGLDRPAYQRYFRWISRFLVGDFGYSLSWGISVWDLIASRFAITALLSLMSLLFAWAVAFPIGVLSAVRKYSFGDYFWTVIGFIGLAVPNFLLALILMYLTYLYFPDLGIGGLFSAEYQMAPWSWGKFINFLGHVWIPVVIVGTAGTASLIRVLRANLIDELQKPYVVMARAKGISEVRVILRYPVRIALNPFLSTVGWLLPSLIAGETITSIVLGLPTAGPLFYGALRVQDMQLAGAYVMLTAALALIGTLVSDILLALIDPRIRYE